MVNKKSCALYMDYVCITLVVLLVSNICMSLFKVTAARIAVIHSYNDEVIGRYCPGDSFMSF